MIRLFTFLWAIVFFSPVLLFSQNAPLVKVWDKTFGGSGEDLGRYILPTSDGGFLLRGISYSGAGGHKSEIGRGDCDVWLVRVDANGNKLWDKTYGGTGEDWGWRMVQTTDGGFAFLSSSTSGISGEKSEASRGAKDSWLLRIDANGNKLWDKTYGGNGNDGSRTLVQTPDGGFLIGPESNSTISGDKTLSGNGSYDFWLIKTDALGSIQWQKVYGGSGMELFQTIFFTGDGYLLGGMSESNVSGDKSQPSRGVGDMWVVKVDLNGNKLWDKTFGGSTEEQMIHFIGVPDGGTLLCGYSSSNQGGDKSQSSRGGTDYWVVKIDATVTNYGIKPLAEAETKSSTPDYEMMTVHFC